MNQRRLLVVTYASPPSQSVAALRWSLMTKYLERLGHSVTVVASDVFGRSEDEDPERIVRPWSLESWKTLRRLAGRPLVKGGTTSGWSPPTGVLGKLTNPLVPDPFVLGWAPFALRAARRIVRERSIDCVVTTSPPESTHLIGLGTRRLGPAWIADFRDGWVFEPVHDVFPTGLQRNLNAHLEARVVKRADVTVAVTDELAADFRGRFGVDTICVPNGWDPELDEEAGRQDPLAAWGLARGSKVRVVYTGRLSIGTSSRRPERFLRALELFSRLDPDRARRLEVVVAGPESPVDAALVDSVKGETAVTRVGQLPRTDALRLQRSADALLLIGGSGTSVSTAKLYEYIAARRPILHIGGPGAASRILAETRSGITVPDDDPEAAVEQLRRIVDGEFGARLSPRGVERYAYPQLAEEMVAAIEEAIRRRDARS